jgi:hypothetical protein
MFIHMTYVQSDYSEKLYLQGYNACSSFNVNYRFGVTYHF